MTESLNDRLDRMESEIKSLSEKINLIKPADISKKDVSDMISPLIGKIKPQEIDISEEIKDAIKQSVTRDFVNKLYRGAK